jgi:catechol 2,3-dioxygenase-like lactoylglutathione lyase family enzyme
MKQRITGIGGIFFKVKNPQKLGDWYKKHLGIPIDDQWGGWSFRWRELKSPKKAGSTIWCPFDPSTKYFGPGKQGHMINYRVVNLKKILAQLKKEGIRVDPKIEESEYGKFGWIKDGEGNRVELWEPPKIREKRKK